MNDIRNERFAVGPSSSQMHSLLEPHHFFSREDLRFSPFHVLYIKP